jgi:hypothetical protein
MVLTGPKYVIDTLKFGLEKLGEVADKLEGGKLSESEKKQLAKEGVEILDCLAYGIDGLRETFKKYSN